MQPDAAAQSGLSRLPMVSTPRILDWGMIETITQAGKSVGYNSSACLVYNSPFKSEPAHILMQLERTFLGCIGHLGGPSKLL